MSDLEKNSFFIVGDNRVECDRFKRVIKENCDNTKVHGNYLKNILEFNMDNKKMFIRSCGRYEDWSTIVPDFGEEKSDAILCSYQNNDPIMGFEHNGSTSAGNNTWQRFPRIEMCAKRGIPYIYAIPIKGGSTRDNEIKEIRTENTAMLVAQIALMIEYRVPVFTLFRDTYWADYEDEDFDYISDESWEELLFKFIRNEILYGKQNKKLFKKIINDMLEYIDNNYENEFDIIKDHPIINKKDDFADKLYDYIYNNSNLPDKYVITNWKISDFRPENKFKKVISTESKFKNEILDKFCFKKSSNKDEYISYAGEWNLDINKSMTKKEIRNRIYKSNKTPLSYRSGRNEVGFIFDGKKHIDIIENTYDIDLDMPNGSCMIVPIKGYTPDTGGNAFSRPDKGMISAMNTLFSQSECIDNIIVILYNDNIPNNWKKMIDSANCSSKKTRTNNLWREIDKFADIVICDTDSSVWYNE